MQKLQLTIPEPCHENWQQMTPTDQGRFCNACAKEVIDFSTMTDIQVLNYFTNLTHEKVCGRALPEQLDRIISRPAQPKKRLFWYWNYFVMFFMFFAKGNTAKAQGGIKPVTECSPVKGKSEVITVAGYAVRRTTQTITGKVTDKDGIPVSFASVKIKGTNTGTIADANGAYSLKVNSNAMLVISGAGFKDAEVVVGTQSFINTVMEKDPNYNLKEVVVTMAVCTRRRPVSEDNKIVKAKPVVIFKVKDDNTDLVIENAVVTITRNNDIKSDTAINQKKGTYEFTKINEGSSYLIKVEAANYQPNEFTIEASDFIDRKKVWEVLLRKQKVEVVKSTSPVKLGSETRIRLGAIMAINKSKEAIYILDGTIMSEKTDINPDDIEDITILNGAKASALFGIAGANGAVIVTSKLKVKNLDTVAVTAYGGRTVGRLVCTSTTSVMGSMVKGVTIKNTIRDTVKIIATKITGAIKLYPNPVQRGQQFNIALKLKQAGLYQVQINDATGRIVLTKQISANAKDFTEKILADNRWSSGVYYISIIDEKNNVINKSSFIVR